MTPRRGVGLILGAALPVGCAGATGTPPGRLEEYRPGLSAETWLPSAPDPRTPVVLLLPGGAWRTADPAGLRPLAAWLARHGVPAVAATYRAADDGVRLPTSLDDIRCAAAWAAVSGGERAVPRPVVLLGHSSGAHLAALVALRPPVPRRGCAWAPADIVGFVGVAGPYDVRSVAPLVAPLVGTSSTAAAWDAADPVRAAAHPPRGLAVLLLHGTADRVVPGSQSRRLAAALRTAGTDVTLVRLPGADHDDEYAAAVAGPRILPWLRAHWPTTRAEGTGAA